MSRFIKNFLLCGLTGWCLEIIFTALCSLHRRDLTLKGYTSIWMFPIYASASFLSPLFRLLQHKSLLTRGLTYMSCIFAAEYCSGNILKKHHLCPWDYSSSALNIKGLIRLDFAPLWFFTGLLFEKLILSTKISSSQLPFSS